MKKLILGILVAFMAISCNQKKIEALENRVAQDSIKIVEIERERDAFLEIISEVQSNFRTIREVELGIIDQTHGVEGITGEGRIRIQEDFDLIRDKIQESRYRIEQLEEDLKKSQGQTAHFRNLVAGLRNELEVRTQEIAELKAQLELKDMQIAQLDRQVASLGYSKDSLASLSDKQIAAIRLQEEELNAGWYVIGTKKELQAKGLKEGDLKTAKFNRGNFKKVDTREFKEIDLGAKKAKLYTFHPTNSYSIEKKSATDKNLVLKIKDQKSFWSSSKYLIIQIN